MYWRNQMSHKLFLKVQLSAAVATAFVVTAVCTPAPVLAEAVAAGAGYGSGTGTVYTEAPGDTLDKVIQKFYAEAPFRNEVLRSAIIQQNLGAFTKGDPNILLAGVMINLPEQTTIANGILNPKATMATDKREFRGENGLGGDTSNMHRNWVRFP